MEQKRVLVFSYSQADWGLLEPIVADLADAYSVEMCVYDANHRDVVEHSRALVERVTEVTGVESMPMSRLFGTIADGLSHAEEVFSDVAAAVVLGDRLQELVAATLCSVYGVPVHHLFAGDRSGCLDDRYRDAVTCLSTHVYAFSDRAARRCRILAASTGNKFDVHHVSMPGAVWSASILEEVQTQIGDRPYVLVRIHPETSVDEPVEQWINGIVDEAELAGHGVLWLPPNQEDGWPRITTTWQEAEAEYPYMISLVPMPRNQYLGLMRHATRIIGNSSSFVHDAGLVGAEDRVQMLGNRQVRRTPMDDKGDPVVNVLMENINAA